VSLLLLSLLSLALGAFGVAPSCTVSNLLPKSDVADANLCPFIWATTLNHPRGIALAKNNDVLVCENGAGQITALWDANKMANLIILNVRFWQNKVV